MQLDCGDLEGRDCVTIDRLSLALSSMSPLASDRPLISAVMPVYNRALFVREAMDSILAQTYTHFEFIIVDDGSSDETPRLVREYAARDARIRPFFLPHGGGPRAANAGIAEARGELIARMDSDDVALPQRFAVQVEWMRQHGLDLCGSSALFFGDVSKLVWFPETHAAIRHELLFRVGMLHPTVMARTEILRAHPYDPNAHHDDYELWTRLAPHYRMGNVPQLLLKHRNHKQQSRVVEAEEFKRDLRAYRRRCFVDLFPDASEEEWRRFLCIAEKRAHDSISALERAGEWLTKLAQIPDGFLRQKMASRWRGVCGASASLGLNCYHVYQKWLPRIYPGAPPADRALLLACALRLEPDSRLGRMGAKVRVPLRRLSR